MSANSPRAAGAAGGRQDLIMSRLRLGSQRLRPDQPSASAMRKLAQKNFQLSSELVKVSFLAFTHYLESKKIGISPFLNFLKTLLKY